LDGQSGDGTPSEPENGHDGLPPLATGNGHVAASSGPPTGAIQGFAEASAAQPVLDPVPAAALPAQPLSVSGAHVHASPVGTMPGVRSRLPDPSELYALPRMPYPRMGYSPAPITVTTRTAITTTVTSSIAASEAQTGLAYASLAGPRAPIPGAYAIRDSVRGRKTRSVSAG